MYRFFNSLPFVTSFKLTFDTDFADSLTRPNEVTNPEMKTVYTIVLKDFLRAEHREIVEIKGLRMESLKALEEILWDHCLCWRKLQFVRLWNSSVLYLAIELY